MTTRRSYKGNAAQTTLSGGISSGATSIPVVDGSSFPDGSAGPFFMVLDKGLVGEEKILVTTRVGNSFTVVTRGQDDSTAAAHSTGATVNHCFTKTDADEANAHTSASAGVHGITGAVVGTTDTQSLSGKTLDSASSIGGMTGTALAALPRGFVGGTTVTANNITGDLRTEVAVPSMGDNSFTAVAGRRYKISVCIPVENSGAAGGQFLHLKLRDGGASAPTNTSTLLQDVAWSATTARQPGNLVCYVTGLSAGTHRIGLFVLTTTLQAGTTVGASGFESSWLMIEDVGT